jgi:hypothetical protein
MFWNLKGGKKEKNPSFFILGDNYYVYFQTSTELLCSFNLMMVLVSLKHLVLSSECWDDRTILHRYYHIRQLDTTILQFHLQSSQLFL